MTDIKRLVGTVLGILNFIILQNFLFQRRRQNFLNFLSPGEKISIFVLKNDKIPKFFRQFSPKNGNLRNENERKYFFNETRNEKKEDKISNETKTRKKSTKITKDETKRKFSPSSGQYNETKSSGNFAESGDGIPEHH